VESCRQTPEAEKHSREEIMVTLWKTALYRPLVLMLAYPLLPALAQAQFTQQGPKLVGSGAVDLAWQGFSVSLSADGDTAIVGGCQDNVLLAPRGCTRAWVECGASKRNWPALAP
jgi:hypothetical protein